MPERNSFEIGEEHSLTRTITDEDIMTFARLTGDVSPLHVNDDYARDSYFGGKIAHGVLVLGLVSAVLGTRLPGPGAVYMSQQTRFTAPVRPGDTITARAVVTAWDAEKGRVTLSTTVTNQDGTTVIDGEARMVMQAYLQKRAKEE